MIQKRYKELPKTLLSRDRNWRLEILRKESTHLKSFGREPRREGGCPICGGPKLEAGSIKSVTYFECKECKHLYCGTSPTPKFLQHYYSLEESAQVEAYVNLDQGGLSDRNIGVSGPKSEFIDFVRSEIPHGISTEEPKWIDIGAGVGDLLLNARSLGYHVIGIEPDPALANLARKRGIEIHEVFLTSSSDVGHILAEADVISLLNVLEHIPEPVEFVSFLGDSMKKGAVLAMEFPRHPSVSSLLQLANISTIIRHINPPEHLHIFSDLSARHLLDFAGFDLQGTWIFGSDSLELFFGIGENLGWEDSFASPPIAGSIDRLQKQIDKAGLSDNMLIVAKKR